MQHATPAVRRACTYGLCESLDDLFHSLLADLEGDGSVTPEPGLTSDATFALAAKAFTCIAIWVATCATPAQFKEWLRAYRMALTLIKNGAITMYTHLFLRASTCEKTSSQ